MTAYNLDDSAVNPFPNAIVTYICPLWPLVESIQALLDHKTVCKTVRLQDCPFAPLITPSTASSAASNMPLCLLPACPELGQTTLDFIGYMLSKKTSKRTSPTTIVPPIRKSNGEPHWILRESSHETLLCREFMAYRIAFYNKDESDPKGYVLYCNSYPRELKLSAV